MSKSLGNVIAPEDILKKYGADILRIWVASSNYAEDLRIDYAILDQHADSYRKIRNTFRYLLGNINDDYNEIDLDNLNISELPELERYILNKLYILDKKFNEYFIKYDFHNLYKELLNFCTVELSAFYFDIRKDTLYCEPKDSNVRKNCIKVLNIILGNLVRWFAPILSFTTEEIFKLVYKDKKSIHLEQFKKIPLKFYDEKLENKWIELKNIRETCTSSIEEKRALKEIGSSLEAKLKIELDEKNYDNFKDLDFAELCITSSAEVVKGSTNEIKATASKARGKKCPLCWKLREQKCDREKCGLINEN